MPIPPYDAILNVLPPHLGDPRAIFDLSPYPCTSHEVCIRFMGSRERNKILSGFIELRQQIMGAGIQGFQWVSGSYVEDVETQEGRPPNDIDVVTFVSVPTDPKDLAAALAAANPNLLNGAHVKANFCVDHFWLPLGTNPSDLVSMTRYWYGLFSHRRDRVWKGMLYLSLLNKSDDDAAHAALGVSP
jgi:hypothetical protein